MASYIEHRTGKDHCQIRSFMQNRFAVDQITHSFENHDQNFTPKNNITKSTNREVLCFPCWNNSLLLCQDQILRSKSNDLSRNIFLVIQAAEPKYGQIEASNEGTFRIRYKKSSVRSFPLFVAVSWALCTCIKIIYIIRCHRYGCTCHLSFPRGVPAHFAGLAGWRLWASQIQLHSLLGKEHK